MELTAALKRVGTVDGLRWRPQLIADGVELIEVVGQRWDHGSSRRERVT